MAIVNMTEAAKLAGIGRATLYRKAAKGLLSTTTAPDGSPGVDTSELFRVFPPGTPQTRQIETTETTIETALLRQKVVHLEELLAVERRRSDELNQRLLELKPRGFFARWFR